MKASQLLRGTRAVHRVRVPLCNFRPEFLPDLPELEEQRKRDAEAFPDQCEPGEVWAGVRVLNGLETAQVLEQARAYAQSKGVDNPTDSDPIYQLGIQVHTIALAYVDLDHPNPDSPDARFFDSVEQILSSPHLGRDGIMYLHEQQEMWQDLCSPQAHRVDGTAFEAAVAELAGGDGFGFFCQLQPGMRWIFTHSMASLLLTLQSHNSPSISGSETTTRKSSKASASKKRIANNSRRSSRKKSSSTSRSKRK